MDLVYVYGPPAAGKLTVTTLARLTGYKLFHKHLSIAAVEPVFEFGTPTFWGLVHRLREDVFATAAREGVSLVFTNVYEHPHDLPIAERRFEIVEAAGGRVCLVQITCGLDELERRLPSPGRSALQELTDVEVFRANHQGRDVFSPIPGRESLVIDTTDLSPADAAMRIIRHYNLPEASAQ
jgi:hypothetical protein